MDRALSGATTPGHSGPRSNGNEGVHRIPQCSSITRTSTSVCLVSYLGHSLVGVLPLCRKAVSGFYRPSRLEKISIRKNISSSIIFLSILGKNVFALNESFEVFFIGKLIIQSIAVGIEHTTGHSYPLNFCLHYIPRIIYIYIYIYY